VKNSARRAASHPYKLTCPNLLIWLTKRDPSPIRIRIWTVQGQTPSYTTPRLRPKVTTRKDTLFSSSLGSDTSMIRGFRPRQQSGHFGLQLSLDFAGMFIGQRAVPASVGVDFCAAQSHRAQPEQAYLAPTPPPAQRFDVLEKATPKRCDGIVVGMIVRGDEAERYRIVGRRSSSRLENTRRVVAAGAPAPAPTALLALPKFPTMLFPCPHTGVIFHQGESPMVAMNVSFCIGLNRRMRISKTT
jgi:hypothetical protein